MGVPRRLGDIQPFAQLAEGATTLVYKGYQPSLDRYVLLKCLKPAFSADAAIAQQFEAEARLLAKVLHPNVVAIYAFGNEAGTPYLAAEFVEGITLAGLLDARPLPPPLAAYLLHEVALGLDAAHRQGILHRDLKPDNIMVATTGHVKITDFGMASLAGGGEEGEALRGTPAYLAPEQVRGAPPAPAADLFALGATFYEMLVGRPAFTGTRLSDFFDAILHHDPLPFLATAGCPEALLTLTRKLLAKDPAERYAGTDALLRDLNAYLEATGLRLGPPDVVAFAQDPAAYTLPARRDVPSAPMAPVPPVPKATPTSPRRGRWAVAVLGLLMVAAGAYALQGWQGGAGAPDVGTALEKEEAPEITLTQGADDPVGDTMAVPSTLPANTALPDDEPTVPGEPAGTTAAADGPAASPTASAPVVQEPPREDTLAQVTPAPPPQASLTIACDPWAIVYVDGDSVGVTPLATPLSLPPGVHTLTFRNTAFPAPAQVQTRRVDLQAGEEASLSVSLWAGVGRVWLKVWPWAEVRIDDVVRDTIPPQTRPFILAPGTYRLTLHNPQGTWTHALGVTPGMADTLSFNLQELLKQE